MTRDEILALAALAGRAPSPHNTQPARWHFSGERVELHEDASRWLPVGDPSGRDNQIALGMAWEAMALALSGRGLGIAETEIALPGYPPERQLRRIAHGRLVRDAAADPLVHFIEQRRCYRGVFAAPGAGFLGQLDRVVRAQECLLAVEVPGLAADYDASALEGLRTPGFAAELYTWMRFSPSDPRAARDGLSADCMGLSRLEAAAAAVALRPAVLAVLIRLGLGHTMVSEAAKVRSATRIVLVHADARAPAFDAGRAWYRAWLALTAAGAAGVPMSALSDSPAHAAALARLLPPGRRLINVMRLGPRPGEVPRSARLPAEELLTAA